MTWDKEECSKRLPFMLEIESTSNSDDTEINMTDNTPNTCGHECSWCNKNKQEETDEGL